MAPANNSAHTSASPPSMLDASGLNGPELMAVYDALAGAVSGLHGVMVQPRCAATDDFNGGYNAAGQMIDAFAEWIQVQQDNLVQTARDRKPTDERDAEMCAWVEIKHQANMMDDPLDLAALSSNHAVRLRSFKVEAA